LPRHFTLAFHAPIFLPPPLLFFDIFAIFFDAVFRCCLIFHYVSILSLFFPPRQFRQIIAYARCRPVRPERMLADARLLPPAAAMPLKALAILR
jgi:hypothetical protein